MAKTSFSKTPSAAPSATAAAATTPATTAPVQPVAEVETKVYSDGTQVTGPGPLPAQSPSQQMAVDRPAQRPFDDENIETTDIVIPRLNIAQKVGDLGNVFKPGSLVLGQTLELIEAPLPNTTSKPVNFVVIGFQPKKFVEKVAYGTQGGQIFDSENEVVDFGGTLDYNEAKSKNIPYFERLATALLIVEKPDNCDDSAFPYEIEGKNYALALYSMKGASYTAAAKQIMTERKIGRLRREGYRAGRWTFQTFLKKFQNGNSAFVPVVKCVGSTTPALQNAVKEIIGF